MRSHERWHAERVIDEARTPRCVSARTVRSWTAKGVISERFALLLGHNVVRLLMFQAAQEAPVAPTPLRSTQTIHLLHDSLPLLATVGPARRAPMGCRLREDLGTFRWPKQPVRLLARAVKRARSRSERKKPEHVHASPLERDLDVPQMVAFVSAGGSAGSPCS